MFTTPLGLLALLAIPAIVAIHLFRRRFPVRPVAGLFLWQIVPADAGRRRQDRQAADHGEPDAGMPGGAGPGADPGGRARCRRPASARISSCCSTTRRRWRRSTRAGESARDRAVRRVLAELDRLGSRARVTLVESGDRPSVLAGPAAFARRSAARAGRAGNRKRRIIRSRSAFGWRASSPGGPAR